MVDRTVLAAKIAAIQDAVARIAFMLPAEAGAFVEDRTVREVVTLNLLVAVQETIALATHWIADEGWDVPHTQGDVFTILATRDVIDSELAARLRSAAGLRNLIAHRYGAIDYHRLFSIAAKDTGDLTRFCQQLARRAGV